jgi:hypothetical protein
MGRARPILTRYQALVLNAGYTLFLISAVVVVGYPIAGPVPAVPFNMRRGADVLAAWPPVEPRGGGLLIDLYGASLMCRPAQCFLRFHRVGAGAGPLPEFASGKQNSRCPWSTSLIGGLPDRRGGSDALPNLVSSRQRLGSAGTWKPLGIQACLQSDGRWSSPSPFGRFSALYFVRLLFSRGRVDRIGCEREVEEGLSHSGAGRWRNIYAEVIQPGVCCRERVQQVCALSFARGHLVSSGFGRGSLPGLDKPFISEIATSPYCRFVSKTIWIIPGARRIRPWCS